MRSSRCLRTIEDAEPEFLLYRITCGEFDMANKVAETVAIPSKTVFSATSSARVLERYWNGDSIVWEVDLVDVNRLHAGNY